MTDTLKACPAETARKTLEQMATQAQVPMHLWNEHSNAVLELIAAWNTRPAERVPEEVRRLYRSEKDQMAKALDANRSDVFIRASNRERTIREVVHTIFGPEGVEQLEGE